MSLYPTSPRDAFLAWCQAHVKTFQTAAREIGLTDAQASSFAQTVTEAANAGQEQELAKQAAKAATTRTNDRFADLRKKTAETVGLIKIFAESSANPANVYTLAQVPPPAQPSPLPAPGTPDQFDVSISTTTGAVTLKWKCENPSGASGTSYIIRRKTPAQSEFAFVGVTGRKTFTDTTFRSGPDSVQYTVQAQRSDRSGNQSQILTINFGAQGTPVPSSISMGEPMKLAA